ncbi:diacylglycerol/lipid kinase family protein [Prescottella agglutinans]|uniref:Diacylglycerol kinase family enzyme n=1 Tax=Prescottella agglutinans TaxID=1644129 RepID=A0ABT6M475_9NOCA|nr:diacylglycerol kinase family protein [Prescottella agglutinans]MDH6279116.1 diacylglycerol kinase family enzyme [Prescottella agglutinans]
MTPAGRPASGDGARRWWARSALVLVCCAAALPVVIAGLVAAVAVLLVGIGGVVVAVAASYLFLTGRGPVRWFAAVVAVLSPIVVVVVYVQAHLLWVVVVAAGLYMLALACGRRALADARADEPSEHPAAPPRKPFIVMNPHSGGGKVERFDLKRRAEKLGAEVALLEGPGEVDVVALAREAVERGADLLGVAGGDGTQALVAAVAAEHDVPFLVICAGTRNHFALDLGLDRENPARCLDALRDGVELRVDLGSLNGRTFVNNASFGVYAEVVQSPAYRNDKTRTVLRMLPDLLEGHRGARLVVRAGGVTVEGPQAVLVSNGPYCTNDLAGLGRRSSLDSGNLGVVTLSVDSTRQAVGLLNRARQRGLTQNLAVEVVVDAAAEEIPVGVDGESLTVRTPVLCTIQPGALRVRVPRHRPGVRTSKPAFDWVRLRALAGPSHHGPRPWKESTAADNVG